MQPGPASCWLMVPSMMSLAVWQGSPDSSSFAIQQPSNGGPYVISKLPLREVITSYHAESHTFKLAAWAFGGVGVAILGTKAAMFGWSKWRDRRIRYELNLSERAQWHLLLAI